MRSCQQTHRASAAGAIFVLLCAVSITVKATGLVPTSPAAIGTSSQLPTSTDPSDDVTPNPASELSPVITICSPPPDYLFTAPQPIPTRPQSPPPATAPATAPSPATSGAAVLPNAQPLPPSVVPTIFQRRTIYPGRHRTTTTTTTTTHSSSGGWTTAPLLGVEGDGGGGLLPSSVSSSDEAESDSVDTGAGGDGFGLRLGNVIRTATNGLPPAITDLPAAASATTVIRTATNAAGNLNVPTVGITRPAGTATAAVGRPTLVIDPVPLPKSAVGGRGGFLPSALNPVSDLTQTVSAVPFHVNSGAGVSVGIGNGISRKSTTTTTTITRRTTRRWHFDPRTGRTIWVKPPRNVNPPNLPPVPFPVSVPAPGPAPTAHPAVVPPKPSADAVAGVNHVYSLDGVLFVEWSSVNLYAPSTVDLFLVQQRSSTGSNQTVFVIDTNVENTGSYAFYLASARSALVSLPAGTTPTQANRITLEPYEYRVLIRSVQKPSVRATSGRFYVSDSSSIRITEPFTSSLYYAKAASGYPFNTYWKGERYQCLYEYSDLTSASGGVLDWSGNTQNLLTSFQFLIADVPGVDISNFQLRYAFVNTSTLTGFVSTTPLLTEIVLARSLFANQKWFGLVLTPSQYVAIPPPSAPANLVIEITHKSEAYFSGGGVFVVNTPVSRSYRAWSDTSSYPYTGTPNSVTYYAASNSVMAVKFAIQPLKRPACGSPPQNAPVSTNFHWSQLSGDIRNPRADCNNPGLPACRFASTFTRTVPAPPPASINPSQAIPMKLTAAPGSPQTPAPTHAFDASKASAKSKAKTLSNGKQHRKRPVGAVKNLDAQFLLFGGISSNFHGEEFFNDLWILNVSSNALYNGWAPLQASNCADPNRPACRYGHTATVISDKMYIFGGIEASGKAVSGDLWVVNTKSFQWSKVMLTSKTPRGTWYHTAETDGIFLYVYGGLGASKSGVNWASNQLLKFDTRNRQWSASDNDLSAVTCAWNDALPCVFRHSMVYFDNNLLIFGGQTMRQPLQPTAYELSNAIIRYDLSEWRTSILFAPDCKSVAAPECRAGHSSVFVFRRMVIYGGLTDSMAANDVWLFDPVTNSFERVSTQLCRDENKAGVIGPLCSGGHAMAEVNNTILVFGGQTIRRGSTLFLNSLFAYRQVPVIDPPREVALSPTEGGGVIEISGQHFGARAENLRASIGPRSCLDLKVVIPDKLITCIIPEGAGVKLPITVALNSVLDWISAPVDFLTYAPPVITRLSSDVIPTIGGSTLSVHGRNFGPASDVVYEIRIGGVLCLAVNWRAHSLLECITPPGIGSNLSVVVLVGGQEEQQQSTGSFAIRYESPRVITIFGDDASTAGGSIVYFNGTGFGTVTGPATTTARGRAWIGTHRCMDVQIMSDSLMSCVVPSGGGTGLDVTVEIAGQVSVARALFHYAAPAIEKIEYKSPAYNTGGGALLNVIGRNFGVSDSADDVLIGGKECQLTTLLAPNLLQCLTPPGTGQNLSVQVRVEHQFSNSVEHAFSYSVPEVNRLAYTQASTAGGDLLTIYGTNFGPADAVVAIKIGNSVDCTLLQSPASTASSVSVLTCVIGAGAGQRLPVTVCVDSACSLSTAGTLFSYDAPFTVALNYTHLPTTGGAVIHITGGNFGSQFVASANEREVWIGTLPCENVTFHSIAHLSCIAPVSAGVLAVDVVIAGQHIERSARQTVAYDKPAIADIEYSDAPSRGGAIVIVTGTNFGAANAVRSVFIGAKRCSATIWQSHTRVTCIQPAGAGRNLDVRITVAGQTSLPAAERFTYSGPAITNIRYSSAPTAGGTLMNITGSNFGDSDSRAQVFILYTVSPAVAFISSELLVAEIPPGSGKDLRVVIEVGGQTATAPIRFSYDPPVLDRVAYGQMNGGNATFPTLGGTPIRLFGTNLCAVAPDCMVWIGNQPAFNITVISRAVPSQRNGDAGGDLLPVDSGDEAPGPGEADDSGLWTLTASGGRLPNPTKPKELDREYEPARVISIAPTTTVDSSTSLPEQELICYSPPGSGWNLPISIAVGGQVSTLQSEGFTYNAPLLTNIQYDETATQGGGALTIDGSDFGRSASAILVRIGYTNCEPVRLRSLTQLTCIIPAGTGTKLPITVYVSGQRSVMLFNNSALTTFTYIPPYIASVSPSQVLLHTSVRLTIDGHSFGTGDKAAVSIGTDTCVDVTVSEHARIYCNTPSFSSAQTLPVVVSVNGLLSNEMEVSFVSEIVPDLLRFVIRVLAGVWIGLLFVLMLVILYFRAHKIIKASSPFFCCLIVIGAMACVASLFAMFTDNVQPYCHLSYWLLFLGSTVLFGSLVVKNYRILQVFNNDRLSTVIITDRTLVLYVGVMLAIDVIILVPFSAVAQCGKLTANFAAMMLLCAMGVYKGGLLIAGVIVALKSRVIHIPEFNERVTLGWAIYNISLHIVLLLPVLVLMKDQLTTQLIVRTAAVLLAVATTMTLLFFPKFHSIWIHRHRRTSSDNKKLPNGGGGGANGAVQWQAKPSGSTPNRRATQASTPKDRMDRKYSSPRQPSPAAGAGGPTIPVIVNRLTPPEVRPPLLPVPVLKPIPASPVNTGAPLPLAYSAAPPLATNLLSPGVAAPFISGEAVPVSPQLKSPHPEPLPTLNPNSNSATPTNPHFTTNNKPVAILPRAAPTPQLSSPHESVEPAPRDMADGADLSLRGATGSVSSTRRGGVVDLLSSESIQSSLHVHGTPPANRSLEPNGAAIATAKGTASGAAAVPITNHSRRPSSTARVFTFPHAASALPSTAHANSNANSTAPSAGAGAVRSAQLSPVAAAISVPPLLPVLYDVKQPIVDQKQRRSSASATIDTPPSL